MTKPIADALVVGDFSDSQRLAAHDRSYRFGMQDGRPFVTVTYGTGPTQTFQVDYTLGAKRYQGYLSRLPDGRIYVLPVFWHIESGRWVDWKEITPIPEGEHGLRQIWNVNCFNCHATNLTSGFDLPSRTYDSRWTEMGIGCEACHGPGREHVARMEAWERDPASKPAFDDSSANPELSEILAIFSTKSAEPRRIYDTCAYCHGNKNNVFTGFRAGDRYEDYALPFLISEPIPDTDLQGEFWPDGRPNRFNRPQALTLSGCFKAGAIACTNCHVAHGSRNQHSLKVNIYQRRNGDLLCTQCHTEPRGPAATRAAVAPGGVPGGGADGNIVWSDGAIERHTFHKAGSAGSRCIGCHMSDVNWRMLVRRRDHTFTAPVPEVTVAVGAPNACNTCHDDKTPEWAASTMDGWWGDGKRRAASLYVADTMYRAGAGDETVLYDLATLLVDRSQGSLIRASAAEFLGRFASRGRAAVRRQQAQTSFAGGADDKAGDVPGTPVELPPNVLNALVGATADPEPVVRAAAVRALGLNGDRADRVLAVVLARLRDEARVVRTRAAEVLLAFGIADLPLRAGEHLRIAQKELERALLAFPDDPLNHTELAWLRAQQMRLDEADAAVDDALRLDEDRARPWVIRGVIAARRADFDGAVKAFRKARELMPAYPGIDRLIEEAEKRKGDGKAVPR
ncbi:MAG: cytochrome c3 family protein [Vicinamibacterales bacterium]